VRQALQHASVVVNQLGVLNGLDTNPADRSDAQIEELKSFFASSIFFAELTELQQLDCCQSFQRRSLKKLEVLFEQGDLGKLFYVVAAGRVAVLINGHEVRQKGQGECLGEIALQSGVMENATRNASVVALHPCELAVLSRADYRRIFGFGFEDVWKILEIPPFERTQAELNLVLETFGHVPWIHDLPYPLLKYEVCRFLKKVYFEENQVIYNQGKRAKNAYIVGFGAVNKKRKIVMDSTEEGHEDDVHTQTLTKRILPGGSFGGDALQEKHAGSYPVRKYTTVAETVTIDASSQSAVDGRCLCAVLAVADFHTACVVVGAAAMRVLRRPPRLREDHNLQLVLQMFQHSKFFENLNLPGLKVNVCRFLGVEKVAAGGTVYEQGDLGEKYYIIMMGKVARFVDNKKVGRKLYPGDGFGDAALKSRRTRQAETVRASEPCIIATLFRNDFNRLMKMGEINGWIDKFWAALIHPNFHEMRVVDFTSYRELHLRIAKTCMYEWGNARGEETRQSDTEKAVIVDWEEDLKAHAPKCEGVILPMLSHQRFADALYMLVDDWTEGVGPAELFIDFLQTVYDNITEGDPDSWQGKHLKPLDEVESKAELLEEKQESGVKAGKAADKLAALERVSNNTGNVNDYPEINFTQHIETAARKTQKTTFKAAAKILDEAIKAGQLSGEHCTISENHEEPPIEEEIDDHPDLMSQVTSRLLVDRLVTQLVGMRDDDAAQVHQPRHLREHVHDLGRVLGFVGRDTKVRGIWGLARQTNQARKMLQKRPPGITHGHCLSSPRGLQISDLRSNSLYRVGAAAAPPPRKPVPPPVAAAPETPRRGRRVVAPAEAPWNFHRRSPRPRGRRSEASEARIATALATRHADTHLVARMARLEGLAFNAASPATARAATSAAPATSRVVNDRPAAASPRSAHPMRTPMRSQARRPARPGTAPQPKRAVESPLQRPRTSMAAGRVPFMHSPLADAHGAILATDRSSPVPFTHSPHVHERGHMHSPVADRSAASSAGGPLPGESRLLRNVVHDRTWMLAATDGARSYMTTNSGRSQLRVCRGAWARVTIGQFRPLSRSASKKHRSSTNTFSSETMCVHLDKNDRSFSTGRRGEGVGVEGLPDLRPVVPGAPDRASPNPTWARHRARHRSLP
jgi:CRP-like cAMP-binding protein